MQYVLNGERMPECELGRRGNKACRETHTSDNPQLQYIVDTGTLQYRCPHEPKKAIAELNGLILEHKEREAQELIDRLAKRGCIVLYCNK